MEKATVKDLAEELGMPPSALIEECQHLGIDAAWAGATLEPVAVSMLRDRFGRSAAAPPLRRGPGPERRATPSKLPPTAVGSLPEVAASLVPKLQHEHGPLSHHDETGAEETKVTKQSLLEQSRRFDSTARTALFAAGLGVVLLVAAPHSPHVVLTVFAWLITAVSGLVAFFAGNRSRYKITTHPEKLKGMAPALVAMAMGLVIFASVVGGVWVVVRDAPASAAPSIIGGRADVSELRWAYHRVARIRQEGWHRPAKDAGTCWVKPDENDEVEPREPERVESTYRDLSCTSKHDAEVLAVFSVNRDADSPYPGAEHLVEIGRERCQSLLESLKTRPPGMTVEIEYPTQEGWSDADHDVACVVVATRRGSIVG
ncbi:MAG: translation initiation factor IF-2 N-terminal domain-containing protein [Acidimicrobiales bacterium]|nr:translation initiation factor IF-2 N-terminal domain-containing protein [Acidimicrobiales bacterium]